MSDEIFDVKNLTYYIDNDAQSDMAYKVARALASQDRIKILRLIACQPLNVYEIALRLNLPFSTVSNHIEVLEEAGIILVRMQQGKKRHVKMCYRHLSSLTFAFKENRDNFISPEYYRLEMPVGHFTSAHIEGSCGMAAIGEDNTVSMLAVDKPNEFFTPERLGAELLWFNHGYVSYSFVNKLYQGRVSQLELSFECCSEIAYHRDEWPSDIFVKINGVDLLTLTSPGDFGGRRGKYSPDDWFVNNTQYGLLYKITVNNGGTYLNNIRVSDTAVDDLLVASGQYISLSIGVDENSVHCGGINLFGRRFGDYAQAIELTVYS